MNIWIEITNPVHGGLGWEFGSCLWSPVENKAGVKAWEILRKVSPGDIVYHFLKKNSDGHHLVGRSTVSSLAQIRKEEPPESGTWSKRGRYYRIELVNFRDLKQTYSVKNILKRHEETFLASYQRRHAEQFFDVKSDGTLQVSLKYLARLDDLTKEIFESYFEEFVPSIDIHVDQLPTYADLDTTIPETITTTVIRKLRDSQIVKDQKIKFSHKCTICGYRIQTKNGYYSEAHHIKPLGGKHNGPDSPNNLLVLCPNHHTEFDYGAIAIVPQINIILHVDTSNPFHGKKIDFPMDEQTQYFLEYHFKNIFNKI